MSNLLIYISETDRFDAKLLDNFLKTCQRIHGIRESPDEFALFTAHFDFADDTAMIEIKANLETVVISRTGVAGLQLCYLLQAFYPRPLHVIDEGYSFDLVMRDFRSAAELREAILAAENKAMDEAE
jgi:hypothetical protein